MSDERIKILILGNGFDLAHNLPTRYSDFMSFCEKIGKNYSLSLGFSDEERNKRLADIFSKWEFPHEEIKSNLLESLKDLRVNNLSERGAEQIPIEEFYNCIKDNVWYDYFKEIIKAKAIRGQNWIDFESEIRHIIKTIDERFDNLEELYGYGDFSGFEYKLKTFAHSFFTIVMPKKTGKTRCSIKTLREICFNDLEDLTRALEIYLANYIEKIECKKIDVISEIKPNFVINFNYTNTYERVYGGKNVFHIHGVCKGNGSLEENNMVLGIDEYWSDGKEDSQVHFAIFKKFVQRIRKKTGIENLKYIGKIESNFISNGRLYSGDRKPGKDYSDGTTFVYVFGHSLDITDKDVLADFFNSKATAVTVYCKDKGAEGELIENVIRLIGQNTLLLKANTYPSMMEFVVQK